MIPYISKEFTHREKLYYWNRFNYKEANTFCRIAVVLHSEDSRDVGDVLSTRFEEPHDGEHAEVVALEHIVNDLKSQRLKIQDNSVVLDVIIRINNSPCPDCQEILFRLLMKIKEMASNSHFRLIIFFSNLYGKTKEGVEEFTEWILKLVEEDVIVILCPLFVCKMVPIPKNISKIAKSDRPIRDQKCIESFRDVLSEIDEYIGSFSIEEDTGSSSIEEDPVPFIEISHELFIKSSQVSKSLFSWKYPHFISIFLRNIPKQLSQLFILDPGFFKSKPIKKEIKERKGRKRQQSNKVSYSAKDTAMKSSKRAKYSDD